MDSQFDATYRSEQQLASIFGAFSGLGIIIAYMGLYGLAAFMAESRTKEIGIRKVLGATVAGIVGLLSREFITLVIGSIVVGVPVVYVAARYWLEDFAYRIPIDLDVFLYAGGAAILVALLTVLHQAVRAALTDPARSLRYE
jgi:putative ABC transport system permease protein